METAADHTGLAISKQELRHRRAHIVDRIARNLLDSIVVFGSQSEPGSIRYLAGYSPVFENVMLILNRDGDEWFITGPESAQRVGLLVEFGNICFVREFSNSANVEIANADTITLEQFFKQIHLGETVGISGWRYCPAVLADAINNVPYVNKLVPADKIVAYQKMVKSKSEISIISTAYNMAESAFFNVLDRIQLGMSERDVERLAIEATLSQGAHGIGYPIWCSSGRNSSCPITKSTDRLIQMNDLVQIVLSAEYNNYCSGVGAPVLFGAGRTHLEVIDAALEVRENVFHMLLPGMPMAEIAMRAKDIAERRGFGEAIAHGPGHSVGNVECEWPFIQHTSYERLTANMIINIDVWLGTSEFGVRLEDGVLITERSPVWLSNTSSNPHIVEG